MILTHALSRSKKKWVSFFLTWLLIINIFAPNIILADEIGASPLPSTSSNTVSPETASSSSSPVETTSLPSSSPNDSLSPSPSPLPTVSPDATLNSGDALATSNSLTETNVTNADSTVSSTTTTVLDPTTQNVSPFPDISPSPSLSPSPLATASSVLDLSVTNDATVSGTTSALANTGTNTQINTIPGQNVSTNTGTAAAVANGTVIANTTLINSTLQTGTVNVMTPWNGDVVIDALDLISDHPAAIGPGVVSLTLDNSGQVATSATSVATTGTNNQTTQGSSTLSTGDAIALSASTNIMGATLVDANVLAIFAQNVWLWNGSILNLDQPGSVANPTDVFGTAGVTMTCTGSCTPATTSVINSADVTNTVTAVANTGGNTQVSSGSATLSTGDAMASAVATTIANSTLINSHLSLLYLMLFRQWNGNLIIAYPDIETTVSAPHSVKVGEDIPFTITIHNGGLARARSVRMSYTIANDAHDVDSGSSDYTDMAPGSSYSRTVTFPTTGRAGHTVVLTADATNTTTEMTASNNSSAATVQILSDETQTDVNPSDPSQFPQLVVTAQNNIHNYVHPGDGVTYDISITNNGPITAHDVYLVHELYAQDGTRLTRMSAPIGTIDMSRRKNIHFVMALSPHLKEGEYFTRTYAVGSSDFGGSEQSNTVENSVPVRVVVQSLGVGTAEAQEPTPPQPADTPQILGAVTDTPVCQNCQSMPWYIALLAGSAVYVAHSWNKRHFASLFRLGFFLPLTSYGGFLWTTGNCRSGLIILSDSLWCRYFLAFSLITYVFAMSTTWIAKRIVTQLSHPALVN